MTGNRAKKYCCGTLRKICGLQLGFLSRYTVVVEWDGFKVGDKVKRRDKGEDWEVGFVTQLEPLKVNFSGTDPTAEGFEFDEVRPLSKWQRLGLGLHDEFNEYVAITEIEPDGAVSAHNAANPAAPVKLRDVLRSVNGSGPTLAEINAAVEAAGRSS